MDEEDLIDFYGELAQLAEPYQDLPFEEVELDELLEGRSDVPKRTPYNPYFHDITFRGVILSQTYRGVWKSAFRLYDDLPTCPEDVSEPQWSSLLFGPDTCDLVVHGLWLFVLNLSFGQSTHVGNRRDMFYIVPDDPDDKLFIVWSLVPKSFRHGSTTYFTDNPALVEHMEGRYARYLRKDVKAKVDEVKGFLADIDAEVPGATESYQTFLIDTAEKCEKNNISARGANTWAQGVYADISCDQEHLQRESPKRCLTRLVNTGHDLRDTIAAERLVLFYREIKPDIESMVYRKKMKRLSWERQNLVRSYYTEYRMTLKPEQWAYVPPLHQISRDSLFSDFLSSEADPMAELSRETALARFPRLISEFMDSQIARLASLLPEETEYVIAPVFFCRLCHMNLRFNSVGYSAHAPCRLYEAFEVGKHLSGRNVLTHATMESVYFWQLLTPEATQFVKEHEPLFPPAEATAWGCNHCPEHFEKSVSLSCAKSHVKEIHNMEWPVIGKDVIAYKHQFHLQPRGYASWRPFHYALEPPCQFMCKMCPKRPVYQLWSMQDLIPHLWRNNMIFGFRSSSWPLFSASLTLAAACCFGLHLFRSRSTVQLRKYDPVNKEGTSGYLDSKPSPLRVSNPSRRGATRLAGFTGLLEADGGKLTLTRRRRRSVAAQTAGTVGKRV
ncbi:uncharacterized protein LACBIDRAFT_321148 [Laccaria bicolor S238N-H82]|uniref:Predicted protein n=1 Tax=Laccaria bicolor (strain S238N-H82 / ATCC MYA-4686) TaxID=486041 RepID=B0CNX3_LACBS|nr:uncharacterized protein LACBIDRAFT_321148 [Laccaria bicolor S238N-H82]EDR15367.1 predicted protein [Laccaria bicolor S238N-H82]|eukprot:XP_001873575.1 predicted protein [Laccaria bicolor S238N-H82]